MKTITYRGPVGASSLVGHTYTSGGITFREGRPQQVPDALAAALSHNRFHRFDVEATRAPRKPKTPAVTDATAPETPDTTSEEENNG